MIDEDRNIEQIKRNSEKWLVKIDVKRENKCTKPNYNIEEESEWKIFNYNKSVQSYASN